MFYYKFNYKKAGISKYIKERGKSNGFRDCLQKCNSSIDFLASWGGSLPSLSPYIEKTFYELVDKGIKFRFLLLMPGSEGEKERRLSRGDWPSGQPETDIRWLLNIRKDLGQKKNNFQIALYSQIPVWSMVVIDNSEIVLGFYVKGVGRDNPGLIMRRQKSHHSFFEGFKYEYERIWEDATHIENVDQFENVLINDGIRSSDGFIFAITGPSGVGKTTHCKLLVDKGLGVPSKTLTTRPPRANETHSGQYEFVSTSEIETLSENGKILCETKFSNHLYGIKIEMVYNAISDGSVLVLDTVIPPLLLRSMLGPKVVIIFLDVTSESTVDRRLSARTEIDQEEIDIRKIEMKKQIAESKYCDYIFKTDGDINEVNESLSGLLYELKKSYSEKRTIIYPHDYKSYEANKNH